MPSRLDLLLINPGNRRETYQSLSDELAAIEPPVWAGLMASYALKKGLSVEILDAVAEGLSAEQAAERAAALDPVLAAVVVYGQQPSASTQNMPAAGAVCTSIKSLAPRLPVLLLGGHVASLPERTLREESADYVCGGEGLATLVDLVAALKAGSGFEKVPDLYYREGSGVRSTPPAPLIRDIDAEIPGIPWHLLPMDRYRAHNWHCFNGLNRKPYASLYTTLGCPYHCSFCCIQAPFRSGEKAAGFTEAQNSYRFWSPQTVVGWIDVLVRKHGVRNIKFADELFVLNARHVHGICDLLIERGYDLNIWAYARVDTVREGMIEKLKAAGVNWLAFGIEAANSRVRDDVQKGFDQNDIARTIKKVQDAGINVIGNYIFGLPEDDLASMQETLDMSLALNCEFGNFYSTMAYPGSPLYEQAVKERWPLPEKWSGYSQHSFDTLPLPTRHLSAAEVLRFRDRAFQVYFTDPRYLAMVERKFGPKTAEHVRTMTKKSLPRKLLSDAAVA
ncbi:MAG TPA: radical SAM protein [Elusimicrobiota bacterium]|nr:radical SAM protein [Elusimicrobiota bacterium]